MIIHIWYWWLQCNLTIIICSVQWVNNEFDSQYIWYICSQWVNWIFSLMLSSWWSNNDISVIVGLKWVKRDTISSIYLWEHYMQYFAIGFVHKSSSNGTQALAYRYEVHNDYHVMMCIGIVALQYTWNLFTFSLPVLSGGTVHGLCHSPSYV